MRSRVLPPRKPGLTRIGGCSLDAWVGIVALIVLAIVIPTLHQPEKGVAIGVFVALSIGTLVWR